PGVIEKIAHGFVRGYAVVARGPDPAAEVASAAARKAEESLSSGDRLRGAREDIGPQDLTVLGAEGTLGFRGTAARTLAGTLPGETTIGLTGTSAGVSAKISYRGTGDEVAKIRAALPGGAGGLADAEPVRVLATARARARRRRDATFPRAPIAGRRAPQSWGQGPAHLRRLAGPVRGRRRASVRPRHRCGPEGRLARGRLWRTRA